MTGMTYPTSGEEWMRWVEARLGRLERHRHLGANESGGGSGSTGDSPCFFRVYRLAPYTYLTDARQIVPFDTKDSDTQNVFTTGSTAAFLAPRDGWVFFTARASVQLTGGSNPSGGTYSTIELWQGNSPGLLNACLARGGYAPENWAGPPLGFVFVSHLSTPVRVTAGRYYSIYQFIYAWGAGKIMQVGTEMTYFTGHYIPV